ncbi:hypothetical protein GQ53DRAFT_748859 [Thozetella sp. PMI_491]|nr:hypothetical protein GQ53DRAFT_748859 [Thozetella sp. PMI_491]
MPHATPAPGFRSDMQRAARSKPGQQVSKQFRALQRQYEGARALYDSSSLSQAVDTMLQARNRPAATKAVSLGLGSLSEKSRDMPRRFKQLAIFTAIGDHLRQTAPQFQLYAQDPSFTKVDELFLQTLGIQVLRTPSPSDLGEAQHVIDRDTLVYSPFLTIAAYRLLLESCPVDLLIGDDFNSLLLKWEKHTTEHKELVQLAKQHVAPFQRRVVNGAGFWEEDDRAFPMALYQRKPNRDQKGSKALAAESRQNVEELSSKMSKARL